MSNGTPDADALAQINQRRAKTLTTIVAEAIEQMIISGELAAGDRINESALSSRLDVSRGPIREACRSLEQAGLLTSAVNRGFYVREMTLEEARNLYEVRGALAGLTGRLLVQRATDKDISALSALVDKMESACENNDFDAYYALNVAFHEHLVKAAGNPSLGHHDHLIATQLHQFRRRGLAQRGSLTVSNKEHMVIIKALAARDESAAEEAMRRHVAGGWTRMSAAL